MTDITLSDFSFGIHAYQGPRSNPHIIGFNVNVTDCFIGLKVDRLQMRIGMTFSNSVFKCIGGSGSHAIEINSNDQESVIFNTCTIGGSAENALSLNGNNTVMFNNVIFDNWTGTYAIEASAGTVVVEGCTFIPSLTSLKKGILLNSGVVSASLLGNTINGTSSYFLTNNSRGDVKRQDTGYSFETHGVIAYPWKTALPKPPNTNLYNVIKPPYNAVADGTTDCTTAIQNALNDAALAGGGTVYLPAGRYKINTHLSIPANVELRGYDDAPHRSETNKGTTLYAVEGKGTTNPDTDTAFITLNGTNAGVRGINVHYPTQGTTVSTFAAFPWTIRGNGSGVYVIDVSVNNGWKGLDLETNICNNHYVNSFVGTLLREVARVGSSTEGWLESCVINLTYWFRSNECPADAEWESMEADQYSNLIGYTLSNTENEHLLNMFAIACKVGLVVNGNSNVLAINSGVDGCCECLLVNNTGSGGLKMISSTFFQYWGLNPSDDGIHINGGNVKLFATLMAGMIDGYGDKPIRISGGTSVIQGLQAEKGMGLIEAGSTKWNSVYLQQTGTHVTVNPGVTNTRVEGCVGGGKAFNYINNAGAGATFTNNIKGLKTAYR